MTDSAFPAEPHLRPQGSSAHLPPLTGESVAQARHRLVKILNSTGFDVKRHRPGRAEFLASRRIDTILDVGANIGQFGREIRAAQFHGRIVSFEPVGRAFGRLMRTINDDPLWTAHHVALSNRDGSARMHVFRDSTFSSLHAVTPAAAAFGRDAEEIAREEVPLQRLEAFDAEIPGERLFLKIDAQGHEKKVLEGTGRLFERIHGVQLELSIIQLYEQSWGIEAAIGFMARLGFVPTHFRPNNFHPRDRLAIVDLDCIFRRCDAAID